jgi:hypothetical protein
MRVSWRSLLGNNLEISKDSQIIFPKLGLALPRLFGRVCGSRVSFLSLVRRSVFLVKTRAASSALLR